MAKTRIVRLLRNGQITIPKEFREALHLGPDDLLSVTENAGKLEVTSVSPKPNNAGSPWFKELYELLEPTRKAIAESSLTEDEINAEIDSAIREVRDERRRRTA
jgi:AbrB family looped-hinge helix DNA binding protein